MALSVAQTAPLSPLPTHSSGANQMSLPRSSACSIPALRNQVMSPNEGLKQQWRREAMADFSASTPRRSGNSSQEVQHARTLLKIAKQQHAAGIRFEGQLTVEQAKTCLSMAQRKENASAYQQVSEIASDALNMLTNFFLPAETSQQAANKPDLAWLDQFETAAAPHFTIKKSALCTPGKPPSLIVIGDGDHASAEVQHRLTEMLKFLEKNNAMTTLVVEYAHPPSRRECRGVPSENVSTDEKPIRCIGGDDIALTRQLEGFIKLMWGAAFRLSAELYQFAKDHHIDAEHLNPDQLTRRVDPLNYAHILNMFSTELYPFYAVHQSLIKKDIDQYLKISDQIIDCRVTYSEFANAVTATTHARDIHLMQTIKREMASGHTTVAVLGDAHVQFNTNMLMENYDCWILDDKSSDYVFSIPNKT